MMRYGETVYIVVYCLCGRQIQIGGDTMTIGQKIRELRIKNHMTQEKLAECLGISTQAVFKWETGVSQT